MICLIVRSGWCSEFAESWFLVMAGHVVPLDAIGVKGVEHGQAHLVVVPVVRLGTWGFGSADEKKRKVMFGRVQVDFSIFWEKAK